MSLTNHEREALDKEILDIPDEDTDDNHFRCPECSSTEYVFNAYETGYTEWEHDKNGFLTRRKSIQWLEEWEGETWVTCTGCDTKYSCILTFHPKLLKWEISKIYTSDLKGRLL